MTEDRETTQEFEIVNILAGHCGGVLTMERINIIAEEIKVAMTTGPCSWAFKQVVWKDNRED